MNHLTDEQLSALVDDALEGGARAAAERHLEACADCRGTLAELVAQDRALASTLEHDPGEEYFESFAGRVGDRIRAAGLAGAQAREPWGRGLADWFRVPRKLALVGAVATVVAGAGIVMLTTREMRVPALREQRIESRAAQEAPTAPSPPGIQPESRSESRPEARSAPQLAAEPVTPLPAAGLAKGTARPQDGSRAKTGIVSREPTVAPAREPRVPTSRAYEVRRNEAGEDVPVGRPDESAYRPLRTMPAPRPAVPGEPVRVQRQRYAEPLGAEKGAEALQIDVRSLPADAGASVSSAGQDAPVAVAKAAREEESKPVAVPIAEQDVPARKELAAPGRVLGLADRADRGPVLQVRGTPEAFDGLPARSRTLAKNAQRLTTVAETIGLAPAWDSAAAGWERLVEDVRGGPLESETRFQVARARFMAWQRAASGKRGARAGQALDGFLAHAPQGAERDSAQTWLARLKK
jgi:anti-sigma factor RsiW